LRTALTALCCAATQPEMVICAAIWLSNFLQATSYR